MLLFVAVILACLGITFYFNLYKELYDFGDNLGVLNVVFVVIIVICSRLSYSEIRYYKKEINSHNKKIIRTRVGGVENGKIILGNKSFSKEEIILNNSDFDLLKGGDDVILELSAQSNTIFSVKRIMKE